MENEVSGKLAETEARSDHEIARDIQANLLADIAVPDANIRIRVRNGNVILEGTVDTLFQRDQAYTDALIARGVVSVTNNFKAIREFNLPEHRAN